MLNSIKKFFFIIAVTVIPMVFGSFLFAGILESYKNNESLNSAILESYRSIITTRAECHKIHNDLYMAYFSYAGSLKTIKIELERPIDNHGKELPKEYILFMQSFIESNSTQIKKVQKLIKQKEDCYSTLYINYEEAAILLNLLEKYESIATVRATELNSLNLSEKDAVNKLRSISVDDLLNIFHTGIDSAMTSNRDKWLSGIEELADIQVEIAKIEMQKFSIEAKTFSELRRLYLEAIKNRLNRGFVDYLIQ